MAWTYSGDPSSSDRDRLRFELGDVDETDQLLQDGEVTYCLSMERTFIGALARAAEAIAQKFAKDASTTIGSISIDNNSKAKIWSERATEYRKRANSAHAPSISSNGIKGYFGADKMSNEEWIRRWPSRN